MNATDDTKIIPDARLPDARRIGGFAAMDPEKQRALASLGGRAAHDRGKAHAFTAEEARAAGQKGGLAVSRDREFMARIGRLGGKARGAKVLAKAKTAKDCEEGGSP